MQEYFPKEIPVARFSRNKRLAHVLVQAKDVTGAMASIGAILASEGIDIRQSAAFAVDKEGYFVYNAFVWIKKEGYSLETLAAKLKGSQYVMQVLTKDGVEGSVVDTLAFPVQFSGARILMLETKALVDTFEALESVFGTGASVIIQQQGVSYGKAQTARLAETLTRPYIVRNLAYGLNMLMAMGWGIPKVVKANADFSDVTIRIDDCFECRGRKHHRESGHFTAGYLTGIFSFISAKELHGRETLCVTTGSDHCEFVISV